MGYEWRFSSYKKFQAYAPFGFGKRPQGDWGGNEQQLIRFTNMHVCPQELFVCVLKGRNSRAGDVYVLFVERVHCLRNVLKYILLLCVYN